MRFFKNHRNIANTINSIDGDVREYARNSIKFHALMEGDPEVREQYIGFGMNAAITCAVTMTISLAGILANILLFILDSISSVGGVFLGLISAIFGVSFAISTFKIVPLIVWQRKLNNRKIGTVAIALTVLHVIFAVALAVTGILLFIGSLSACAA